jgi:hypothetical protein
MRLAILLTRFSSFSTFRLVQDQPFSTWLAGWPGNLLQSKSQPSAPFALITSFSPVRDPANSKKQGALG